MNYRPDYYTVVARNVIRNPALNIDSLPSKAAQISMFSWSTPNQSDINAKLAYRIPGTNDWIYERFPVNDNAINNYFLNGDDIKINVYASDTENSNGNMVAGTTAQWIVHGLANEETVAYITYSQNTGFNKPTVWNGQTSSQINNPESTQIEGFRISSALMDTLITSEAYVPSKGWITAQDGQYCGTMNENPLVQALKLTADGELVFLNELSYRV